MRYGEKNFTGLKGLTLMEMVIAMAIITVIFASILPLFRNVQAGWDVKRGTSEALQNGRVAMEFLNQNIAKSLEITAVSLSSSTDGFIEFVDNDGITLRCDLSANNYIRFGPVGSQEELAGPVTGLKFTCYALDDLDTPITDVESIRLVKINADFVNAAANGPDKPFSTSAYIQAGSGGGGWAMGKSVEYDKSEGDKPTLVKITDGKYLCIYEQKSDHGWASVLSVDTEDLEVTAYPGTEYSDSDDAEQPFVIKLDTEHYMVFYFERSDDPGYVGVLTVDTDNWTVSLETSTEWEPEKAEDIVAVAIDSTHFLCLYMGDGDDAYAAVLQLDRSTWQVTVVNIERIYNREIESPDLLAIDENHFIYVYERDGRDDLYAGVLKVDLDDWDIKEKSRDRFDKDAEYASLARIDSTHYLCTFVDDNDKYGVAVILEVDTDDWEVDDGDDYIFYEDRLAENRPVELIKLEDTDDTFLALFSDEDTDEGYGVVLTVDIDADVVTCSTPYMLFDDDYSYPSAIWIEGPSYLCAYKGKKKDGFAFVFNYSEEIITP